MTPQQRHEYLMEVIALCNQARMLAGSGGDVYQVSRGVIAVAEAVAVLARMIDMQNAAEAASRGATHTETEGDGAD